MHVMIDLETMGLSPNGAIASIGAVRFDPFSYEMRDPFHLVVDLSGQDALGRAFTGSTVTWWLQQSEAARAALYRGDRLRLPAALAQFATWYGHSAPTWAYGSTFDHTILDGAFKACKLPNPVHYRDQLCMRGLVKLAGIECPVVPGEAHNALDDAQRQARWVQKILKERFK
jgi:DNA polymerase III epsilon subunit-like protein